jgi:hypothetical protein
MIGERFGKWTVIKEAPSRRWDKFFECRCDCGTISNVAARALKYKRSCQCFRCSKKSFVSRFKGKF